MRSVVVKNSGLLILTFCFSILTATAQEIKVSGGFMKDSIRIGESVGYYLSAAYPQSLTVLFPDSTFSFAPFEFSSKKIFPTNTVNGTSRDSVVYYLTTFEIDKVQVLDLPVFVTSARDCTAYQPSPDSIYLVELVPNPPDSVKAQNLPLKTNTLYEKVFKQFNYIIALIAGGVLLILAIFTWIVFGKRIIKYFRMKKLKQGHLKFLHAFTGQFEQLATVFSRERAEATVSIWKKYLEHLEQKPYTKLTTRETIALEGDERLGSNLQMIDRAIYGNQAHVHESFEELKKFAEERFLKKLEEVKNG